MRFFPQIIPRFNRLQDLQADLSGFARRVMVLASVLGIVAFFFRQAFFLSGDPYGLLWLRLFIFLIAISGLLYLLINIDRASNKFYRTTLLWIGGLLITLGAVVFGARVTWALAMIPVAYFVFLTNSPLPTQRNGRIIAQVVLAAGLMALLMKFSSAYQNTDLQQAPFATRHVLWAMAITAIFGLHWRTLIETARALGLPDPEAQLERLDALRLKHLRLCLLIGSAVPLTILSIQPWLEPGWAPLIKNPALIGMMVSALLLTGWLMLQSGKAQAVATIRLVLLGMAFIASLGLKGQDMGAQFVGTQWIPILVVAVAPRRYRAHFFAALVMVWAYLYASVGYWHEATVMALYAALCGSVFMWLLLSARDRLTQRLYERVLAKDGAGDDSAQLPSVIAHSGAAEPVPLLKKHWLWVFAAALGAGATFSLVLWLWHDNSVVRATNRLVSTSNILKRETEQQFIGMAQTARLAAELVKTQKTIEGPSIASEVLLRTYPAIEEVAVGTQAAPDRNTFRSQARAQQAQPLATRRDLDPDTVVLEVLSEQSIALHLHTTNNALMPTADQSVWVSMRFAPDRTLGLGQALGDLQKAGAFAELVILPTQEGVVALNAGKSWRYASWADEDLNAQEMRMGEPYKSLRTEVPLPGGLALITVWTHEVLLAGPREILLAVQAGLLLSLIAGLGTLQAIRVRLLSRAQIAQIKALEVAQAEGALIQAQNQLMTAATRSAKDRAALFDKLSVAVCEKQITPEGHVKIIRANPAYLALSGLDKASDELAQTDIYLLSVHPEDQARVRQVMLDAQSQTAGKQFQFRYQFGPRQRHIEATIAPVTDADGNTSWLETQVDITDHVLHEQRIQEMTQTLEPLAQLARYTTNAVFFTDANWRITWMNEGASRLSGVDVDEAIGQHYWQVFSSGDTPPDKAALARHGDLVFDLRGANKKSGLPFWLHVNLHGQRDANDAFTGAMAVATDTTASKSVNAMLQDMNQRLQDLVLESRSAVHARDKFITTVADALAAPLQAIALQAETISKSAELDQSHRQQGLDIARQASAATDNLHEALAMIQLEKASETTQTLEFDPHDLVDRAVQRFAARSQQKQIAIKVDIHDAVPARVRGDLHRIELVLTKLLDNALKFTASGEIAIRLLAIPAGQHSLRLRCEVQDEGLGMPQAELARVFDDQDERNPGTAVGSNLSLRLVKRLVALMDGDVDAKSVPGKGSTFSFVVPLDKVD